jgi:hypothetical protein
MRQSATNGTEENLIIKRAGVACGHQSGYVTDQQNCRGRRCRDDHERAIIKNTVTVRLILFN